MSQFYKNVNAGDDWSPEPAQRYNDVNALLSQFGPTGAGRFSARGDRLIYSAVNRSMYEPAQTIYAGTGVEPCYELTSPPSTPAMEAGGIVPVMPRYGGAHNGWGVALSDMKKFEVGSVMMSGVVQVRLAAALPAGTQYVEPGGNFGLFFPTKKSRAWVISSDDTTALVMLSSSIDEYQGPFAVRRHYSSGSSDTINIVDGRLRYPDTDSNPAGYASIDRLHLVKKSNSGPGIGARRLRFPVESGYIGFSPGTAKSTLYLQITAQPGTSRVSFSDQYRDSFRTIFFECTYRVLQSIPEVEEGIIYFPLATLERNAAGFIDITQLNFGEPSGVIQYIYGSDTMDGDPSDDNESDCWLLR